MTVDKAEKVVINVSGRRFQTWRSTLRKHPDTLLGGDMLNFFYDSVKKEYFFDRDPYIFRHVLRFYQVGKLHVSYKDCLEAFHEELKFFGISADQIHECCWLECHDMSMKILRGVDEKNEPQCPTAEDTRRSMREKVYDLLEGTAETKAAKFIQYSIGILIVLSVLFAIVESLNCAGKRTWEECYYQVFEIVDWIFGLLFTVEYLLRVYSAPHRGRFFNEKLNVVDLIALCPFYVDVSMRWLVEAKSAFSTDFLDIFRVVRAIRILKLGRHSQYMRKFGRRFKKAISDLGFLYFAFFLADIFFAVCLYAVEGEMLKLDTYPTIPSGMWYAVVTMMTVGYGDVVPQSIPGKIIGAFSCIFGIIILALPIPILQNVA